MDCKEAILSNDYMDFIWKIDVRLTGQAEHPFGVCTQYINRNFSVFYMSRDEILRFSQIVPI